MAEASKELMKAYEALNLLKQSQYIYKMKTTKAIERGSANSCLWQKGVNPQDYHAFTFAARKR